MDLRQASAEDFDACAAIVTAVQSTHVWQLRLAYDATTPQLGEELGATLHRSRLPRPITIRPSDIEPLDALWERAADVIVAEDPQGIAGYIVLHVNQHRSVVDLARLAVAPLARRAGIGSQLLSAAVQWGAAYRIETLVGHCAARNDAAVNFYARSGLRFAGYSEAFYPRGEVALLWARQL